MVVGVIAFSFATGTLQTILSRYDKSQKNLNEKMNTFEEINEKYSINKEVYDIVRKEIRREDRNSNDDIQKFQEKLPYAIKLKLSMKIHKEIHQNLKYFMEKPPEFIALVAPLLVEAYFQKDQAIYKEGEPINFFYFLLKGEAGFVLPRY